VAKDVWRIEEKMSNRAVLGIEGVTKQFGGVIALDEVTISLKENELVGLIGPNGSGKTTLFNCITGILRPESGSIVFRGENITGQKAYNITLKGMTRTYQLVHVFPKLSVLQNMVLGIIPHQGDNIIKLFLNSREIRNWDKRNEEKALELLDFVGILKAKDDNAYSLSYGQQKLLELAVALMSSPKLLLLDEPLGGVNPTLINAIMDRIIKLHERGLTLFVIEHNMHMIMSLSQRIIVLDNGTIIADGSPTEIKANERVIQAYFGG
jgi:ABC-type branched-subunit amino acid transport system ATPase component